MNLYALLVGINKYKSPSIHDLSGCVTDVERFATFLKHRTQQDDTESEKNHLHIKTLIDAEATRENIINQFRNHLSQASGRDDVVLFYYSGHGSQEHAPELFWHIEPDKKNETLVCHESRSEGGLYDLADKELAFLLHELTAANPDLHTAVILDSCHSGSGTRNTGSTARLTPQDPRIRPIESYLTQSIINTMGNKQKSRFTIPHSKHILLAACRPEEQAYEKNLGEGQERAKQGVFSYYIRKVLSRAQPNLTYHNLFRLVSAMVRYEVSHQTPQIENINNEINQPFLGGQLQPSPDFYTIYYDQDENSWLLDAGAIHGIPTENEGNATQLNVYPATGSIKLEERLGILSISKIMPGESKVQDRYTQIDASGVAELTFPLQKGEVYYATIFSTPLAPVCVELTGSSQKCKELQDAIASVNNGSPSLHITSNATTPRLRVTADTNNQKYSISRIDSPNLLLIKTRYGPNSAFKVVRQLEQIARWMKLYELNNPTSKIPANAVALKFTLETSKENSYQHDGNLDVYQIMRGGEWDEPKLRMSLTNHGTETYYCAILHLTSTYSVTVVALPGSVGTVQIAPNETVQIADGQPYYLFIDQQLAEQGATQTQDLFKLIISTTRFDPTVLDERELPVVTRGDIDPLTHLLNRIRTRNVGFTPQSKIYDWAVDTLNITIYAEDSGD